MLPGRLFSASNQVPGVEKELSLQELFSMLFNGFQMVPPRPVHFSLPLATTGSEMYPAPDLPAESEMLDVVGNEPVL